MKKQEQSSEQISKRRLASSRGWTDSFLLSWREVELFFVVILGLLIFPLSFSLSAAAQSNVSVEASHANETCANAYDAKSNTLWASGSVAEGEDVVYTFKFDAPLSFDMLGIRWGGASASHIRMLLSVDGTSWTEFCATNYAEVARPDQFVQGLPMGELLKVGENGGYKYVRLVMTPIDAAEGIEIREFYFDTISSKDLKVSHKDAFGATGSTYCAPNDILFTVTLSGAQTYQLTNGNSITIDATRGNSVYTSDELRFVIVQAGTNDFILNLHKYGASEGEYLSKSVRLTLKNDFYNRDVFVHTPGIADPKLQSSGWKNVPSRVDTSFLTADEDSRIKNPGGVRQRTHVTEHRVYALPGETINLMPYTDFYQRYDQWKNQIVSTDQYKEVIVRWYDYATDEAHPWLSLMGNNSIVVHANYGMYAGKQFGNRQAGAVGQFTVPEGEDFDQPAYIALDASQRNDLNAMKRENGKLYEPLVNFRHIFIVENAAVHAEEFSGSAEKNAAYVEGRKRYITARIGTKFHVRLQDPIPDGNFASGIYYKTSSGEVAHVGSAIVRTTTPAGTTSDDYFVLDDKTLGPSYISITSNKYFYRTISCTAEQALEGTFTVQIIGKDLNGNEIMIDGQPLVIQEYGISFVGATQASLLNEAEIAASGSAFRHQTREYLTTHFGEPIDVINYDQYPLSGPDTDDRVKVSDNGARTDSGKANDPHAVCYRWPVPWDESNYAFGYEGNYDYNEYVISTHTYCCPWKTFAAKNPASNNYPGSPCNPNGITGVFDHKFYETKGQEQGYFYYVNGAGDPGIIARINIPEFCLGSAIYVQAWVNEFSENIFLADLIFNFNVVLKDGNSVTLHSFTPGAIPDVDHCAKWTRMYYSFVPNTSHLPFQPEEIKGYELLLENNCTGSDGADYAVDDIRVWVCKPEVRGQQMVPLCAGEKETEVKVKVNFNSLLATIGMLPATKEADNKQVTFYYTFLDKDKYETWKTAHYDEPGYLSEAFNNSVVRYQYNIANDEMTQGFGKLIFNTMFSKNRWPYEVEYIGEYDAMRDIEDGTEYIIFNTYPTDVNLYPGKEYIIALWAPEFGEMTEDEEDTEEFVLTYDNFRIEDACSKTCVFRVHAAGVIKVNGEIVSDQENLVICENQYPVIQIDVQGMVPVDPDNWPENPATKMTVVEENAPYDWYFGGSKDYFAAQKTLESGDVITLDEAIHCYREYYNGDNEGDDDITRAVPHLDPDLDHLDASNLPILLTQDMIDYIKELATTPVPANDNRPILLLYKRACPITPRLINGEKEYKVVAVPIRRSEYWVDYDGNPVRLGTNQVIVCTEPTEVYLQVQNHGPVLLHGFAHDEHYPETLTDVPLRIGYDQIRLVSQSVAEIQKVIRNERTLSDMASNVGVLTVPLRIVKSTTSSVKQLRRSDDGIVYLYETNDPEYRLLKPSALPLEIYPTEQADDNILLPQVGLLLEIKASTSEAEIQADHDYFRLVFRDDFRFKEGYYYRFRFSYQEQYVDGYTGERSECDGQTVMTLKIVPKYQMWVGDACTDFNDDHNWRRITSDELHHAFTGDDDPLRAKLADGYNGPTDTPDAQARATGYANRMSYVPMDFTDIIIPDTDHFPRLYHRTSDDKWLSYNEDGVNYSWLWPQGRNDGEEALNHTATVDIEYDMAAWNSPRGINCRPWYANTCEHVTFLPGAEIYGQQHLKYQRAWVELEVKKDRWYNITSPLCATVAGDMYAPTLGARQLTEHFQPITFDTHLNDRFRPAVFQRSWDHKGMARVYRKDADGMYGAGVTGHSVDDAYVAATWSHVYNDVEEVYTDGHGFSVYTDVSRNPDAASIDYALFRLPKDDDQYDYHSLVNYDQNGQNANPDATARPVDERYYGDRTEIERGNPVVLATDTKVDGTPLAGPEVPPFARLNPTSGTITVSTQTAGKYFLVGNPFMAHLDMQKFFAGNPDIEPKYWILTEGRQGVGVLDDDFTVIGTPGVTTSVAPLQAFFVEAKEEATSVELTYDEGMMKNFAISNPVAPDGSVPAPDSQLPADEARPSLKAPAQRASAVASGTLNVTIALAGHPVSTAVVALTALASDAYEEAEDAILLLDSNLDTTPSVYTVASATALSVNRLESISMLPLGVVCQDDEAALQPVELTFYGADTFPQPLYLLNAATGESTPITDDFRMLIPARSAGQYFITTGIGEVEEGASASGPVYNLKGIRVANTRNERVLIQGGRKTMAQ